MASQAPSFWWTKPDWRARLLWPVSLIYGRIAGRRMADAERASVPVPVICIGNFTVGGAGKTPTALTIAQAAKAKGLKPGFLSRGYGGTLKGTTVVNPELHDAKAVGDEPLLLAREALTVISPKRVEGARRLVEEGVDLIIMDDGFQSARLAIDYALLVIDTGRGIGNGLIVPSGPVRAPMPEQMRQASALLKVGKGNAADAIVRQAARAGKPFLTASLKVRGQEGLAKREVLAFAGIADPQKFFRTVEETGARIAVHRPFGDHKHLREAEIAEILDVATSHHLEIVTTSKDLVRLLGRTGRAQDLVQRARVIEVEMTFEDHRAPGLVIDNAFAAYRQRRLTVSRSKTSD